MNMMAIPMNGVSAAEWEARCKLAALYRLVAHYRMTDLIFTHISARVPGPDHHFLINRFGRLFGEMRASDLVKIDLDGNIVGENDRDKPVNAAGFVVHSSIHAAREELICVIHTHTAAGIAVAAQKEGLLPLSQHALKFYGHLSYHDYEGIALDSDECARLAADLGPKNRAMILRNHGLLVGGRTFAEAFEHIYILERACQAQVAILSGGRELNHPSEEACLRAAEQHGMGWDHPQPFCEMAWDAALRELKLEETDCYQ